MVTIFLTGISLKKRVEIEHLCLNPIEPVELRHKKYERCEG